KENLSTENRTFLSQALGAIAEIEIRI
ncbi:MAG: hypothetical protein ACI8YQ_003000, partial [Polaribacter sp.]